MSDRGDYRSIYCSFWDDPDVHALGHLEYRVLTTLKGTLPASGLGVYYLTTLAERCAATAALVEVAIAALCAPLPGKSHGWVVRERNVAWIVNALRYEPTLTPANPKHRTYLSERLLAPLGKGRPIVEAFQRYYPEWFPGAAPVPQSDAIRMGIERVSDHSPFLSSPSLPDNASSFSRETPIVVDGETITEPASASIVLTAAANRGITERYGEQTRPILWSAGTTSSAVDDLTASGIPIDFARDAIYTACLALKGTRPPSSLNYFTGIVRDRWTAHQAHTLAASIMPNLLPAADRRSTPASVDAALEQWGRDADDKERKRA